MIFFFFYLEESSAVGELCSMYVCILMSPSLWCQARRGLDCNKIKFSKASSISLVFLLIMKRCEKKSRYWNYVLCLENSVLQFT